MKKIFFLLFLILLTITAITVTASTSGTCGYDLTWTLDDEGTLTVSGTGDMTKWTSSLAVPWDSYRNSIKKVNIGEGVTSISFAAFYECDNLTSVVIPDSVTSIGNSAFYDCESLTSINTLDGVTSISNKAFCGCESLTSINIPNVTVIGTDAFNMCYSLTSIEIPNGVISIGDYAFSSCIGLQSITIPYSVKSIGFFALGYYFESVYLGYKYIPGFTIYGYEKSSAEAYANLYDIPFVAISCEGKHFFEEWTVTDATCTEDGTKTRSCSACGAVENETIYSEGHSYSAVVTEPNCTDGGYTTYTCANCSDSYVTDETESLGHILGEWIIDTPATATECGSMHRNCLNCKYAEEKTIAPVDDTENAVFTLSSTSARPGETVKLTLSLKTQTPVNSIALRGITYDTACLEFVGFGDYEALEKITALPPVFDTEKMNIIIGFAESAVFDGDICTLEFRVLETATDCITTVTATPIVKLSSDVVSSDVNDAEIKVYTYITGDIDGDEDVDIDDAVLLFCYSMIPDDYPVGYKGTLDFTKDGKVDIRDTVLLFNYSMLPDIYPLQ